jgi:hypothetical protein
MTGLVVFDVDGTVTDGVGEARPGIYELLEVLHALDYQVRLWSARGQRHARVVQAELLLPFIDGFHDKPASWAGTAAYCHEVMGRVPDLIVDDMALPPIVGSAVLKMRHAFEVLHPEVVVR